MSLPIGSALLCGTFILIAGGFGRLTRNRRALVLFWLGTSVLLHLLSVEWPQLRTVALGLLGAGAATQIRESLRPLALSALCAATAAAVLLWPAGAGSGIDPTLLAAAGIGGVAAVCAPLRAVVGVAVLAALLGGLVLAQPAGAGALPPPDVEDLYQLLGAAGVLSFGFSLLRGQLRGRLGGVSHG